MKYNKLILLTILAALATPFALLSNPLLKEVERESPDTKASPNHEKDATASKQIKNEKQ